MENNFKPHSAMHGNDIRERCVNHLNNASALRSQFIKSAQHRPFLQSLGLYNDILVEIDAAMSQASLFSQVHPNAEIRKEAEISEQEIAQFVTDLSLDNDVYNILNKGKKEALTNEQKRMLDRTLQDFRRAGVNLDEDKRRLIKKLKAELVTLGQEFGQNIRQDRFVVKLDSVDDLAGLPKDYLLSHKPDKSGKIEISTDYPDYIPFMQYAHSDKWRKELRHKYLNRGEKNGPVLQSLMEKRNQLAKLLNYKSFADYIVEDKMIKNAKAIHDFIGEVATLAKSGADREYQALLEFKRQKEKSAQWIYGHESVYLEESYRKEKFNFDSQMVRPYFSYRRVLDGLLNITSRLFALRYVPVTDAAVWHESVVSYDVYDESGKLGRIFLDMHPREGKYKHAAQFNVVSGLKGRQYAEGALVCNFANPNDGPALMDHSQVVTMFHEFGHLLHHVLAGNQEWMPFSGVATEWDFVEGPSQFLEEWAWSPSVLETFALHYETNEPIPETLVNTMKKAKEFGKALAIRQQTFYAALSVDYFDKEPKSIHPLEHLKTLQAKYSYFPYEEGTHFNNSFGHLDGYSAMYYTYLWSLVMAKNLFEPFKQKGLMDSALAARYRDLVLKPGGAKDAADLVKDFLGRPYNFDAFKSWLTGQ